MPSQAPPPDRSGEGGKLQRDLARLLADIAAARADLARQAEALKGLHDRLARDLTPWEGKLAAARRDTLRILGRQYREGWLPRRDGERLREALRGLADELEAGFGLDLAEERRAFLDQVVHSAAERAALAEAERSTRQARLEALRKAIGNEAGPQEAAAREKRERMDALRKALRGDAGGEPTGGREQAKPDGARRPEGAEGRGPRVGPGPGNGGRGRADEGTKAQRKEAEEELSIAGDFRALYVILARALHPDKERDPARRDAKTAWMQKVTAAYAARDLARLLDILAQDPLGSVGPYLSAAPAATVKGFAKRLRRELANLQAQALAGRAGVHPSLRRFLGPHGINETEVKHYATQLKKELRFVKRRNELYRERSAVEEMLKAMGGDWRGYL
jgi:hypothetical protein